MAVAGAQKEIREKALAWEGIEARVQPKHFGALGLMFQGKELGHIHGNRLADIHFPKMIRDQLVAAGEAVPHHILPHTGWVSLFLREPADVERAVGLFRKAYEGVRSPKD